ncbi:VRR-NUC domain-containing protein [Burkholderia sp. D7]|nr:VRR-NUC domain-containing protein [Burkholderia sp. D7]
MYSFMETSPPLANFQQRFYYLLNFETALEWLAARYDDLWSDDERAFLLAFPRLPLASRALLVRMLMRTGSLFRASKLGYDEIGCPLEAAAPLAALGWVDTNPLLSLDEIFSLHTKAELAVIIPGLSSARGVRKSESLTLLRCCDHPARGYADWHPEAQDEALRVTVTALCERLRLMFFGNLRQSWSEFVLADLGVFRYERVALEPSSRAFGSRDDVDVFLAVHACRERLDASAGTGETLPLEPMIREIEELTCGQHWLDQRRHKLLYRIGQHCERHRDWALALASYANCTYPGARHRRMRVLEQCGRDSEALDLAHGAHHTPESEEEAQRLRRMLPRLRRKLGLANETVRRPAAPERGDLVLARPPEHVPIEIAVRDALGQPDDHAVSVYYVENELLNSLFGLLCWDAIFAGVPGAFFHSFQRGPADLYSPNFFAARCEVFERCLARLDDGTYQHAIQKTFIEKAGLQSPFVHWRLLTKSLLEDALLCIPAAHLKLWFTRLMRDIRANRTGFPDLIRFWPAQRRYEMVEVKGPGDRLQDNQIRWLTYCAERGMPVQVIHVRWAQESDEAAAIA